MSELAEAPDTILIVDDEAPVRKTFSEWLEGANLPCRLLTAADAEEALVQANQHTIDLAILDWNLGAGNDGLRLLEDLFLFNPDVVAIMITGFAQQATPLDAMRMGVRDYLDKNQDLDRTTFLNAVRRQLERIRPAKRERRLHQSLKGFRAAVEKVLPLVQASAALNDPLPLPEAVRSLFRFLLQTTGARDGVVLLRSFDPERQPAEVYRAHGADGAVLPGELVPFAQAIAGMVVSLQQPQVLTRLDQAASAGTFQLQTFERGRDTLLAVAMNVAPGFQAVLELFDKSGSPGGFTAADQRLVAATADFGAEMLRQAVGERGTHRLLFDAMEAALGASESVALALRGSAAQEQEEPPPQAVMERLRESLETSPRTQVAAEDSLRLAEAVRVLALRHGTEAVRHCIGLVESLRQLLDTVTGTGEA